MNGGNDDSGRGNDVLFAEENAAQWVVRMNPAQIHRGTRYISKNLCVLEIALIRICLHQTRELELNHFHDSNDFYVPMCFLNTARHIAFYNATLIAARTMNPFSGDAG